MVIKSHKEDVLSHMGDISENVKLQWMEGTSPVAVEENIKGCFSIFDIAELCWDISEVYDSITITFKVFGKTVGKWHLDKNNTCIKIHGFQIEFKEELEVCVDWSTKNLTMKGKTCYWSPFKWHCKSFDVTLIHW